MPEEEEFVYLQCQKVQNRLRVRVISNNYFQNLNCQFPRALRVENQIYRVPAKDVRIVKNLNKDFYFIAKKNIALIGENIAPREYVKIFTEENDDTCCICLDNKKFYVYISCGHFYVCKRCQDSRNIPTCPICRAVIVEAVPFSELKM